VSFTPPPLSSAQEAPFKPPPPTAAEGSFTPPSLSSAQSPLARVGNTISPVHKGAPLDNMVRATKVEQHKASINPLEAVDAVLGGPERFLFGLAGSHGDIGHAWQSMTHPGKNDEVDTDNTLALLGIHPPKGQSLTDRLTRTAERTGIRVVGDPLNAIPLMAPFKMAAKAVEGLGKAAQAAEELGATIPGFTRTINAGKTLSQAAYKRISNSSVAKMGHEMFARRPELDAYLDKTMKATRIGVETKHRTYEAVANGEAEAALHAPEVEKSLRNMKPGDELHPVARNLYNQQIWRHGNEAMRAQISIPKEIGGPWGDGAHDGYRPTEEDLKLFPHPTGALNHNLMEDYQTLINPRTNWGDSAILRDVGGKHRDEFAGFEQERTSNRQVRETDQFDRTLNRLRIGNARVRQVMTDRETEQILKDGVNDAKRDILAKRGLDPNAPPKMTDEELQALDAEARKKAGWRGEGPVNVGKLSHTPKRAMPDSPLRALGRLQKAAIKINPFPHGLKNVGMLAFLHGGPEAFGKGLAYAWKGVGIGKASATEQAALDAAKAAGTETTLAELRKTRLVNMGVDADYVRDFEHPLDENALNEMSGVEKAVAKVTSLGPKATGVSNNILTRLEMGYRQSLLDQLDRKWPRLADPKADALLDYKKGDIIRSALGDYRNVNYFISVLDALGGPFVAFRLGIVPGAVTRALIRRPNYVESVAHAQGTFNDSFQKGQPSEGVIGGPVDDWARLMVNPLGTMESPSTLGPWGTAMRYADPNRTVGGGSMAEDTLRAVVPGAGMVEDTGVLHDLLGGGYQPPPGVSPGASLFASMLGAYYRKRPSPMAEQRYEAAERKAP